MRYSKIVSKTPQSEPLDKKQVANNAGGFVYTLDAWKRLDRFLILGSDAPTYYQRAQQLTAANCACVNDCYNADPLRTVKRIIDISYSGRAPKNDSAIFALALGASHENVEARRIAVKALPEVCRTSTHLFTFVDNCRALGKGWGRALKMAVAKWYDEKTVERVAWQAIKYRSRTGYQHKRLLDMSHARSKEDRRQLYHWMKGKPYELGKLPTIIQAHIKCMDPETDLALMLDLIRLHRLPWEAIPTAATANGKVWSAMLPHMGLTAMLRNLGNMTRYEALQPLTRNVDIVVKRLGDAAQLKAARVHPFSVLLAAAVYGSGQGVRGSGTWEPSQPIMAALDEAFDKAFVSVEPANKRTLIGLDVSGSMTSPFMGSPLTCSEACAAIALTTIRTEPQTHVFGFADEFRDLGLNAKMSLGEVTAKTRGFSFGGTDCSLPMVYAQQNGLEVDTFLVLTDNETWAGSMHPVEALRQYRRASGVDAKLIVAGMTSTGFTIADPNDAGMLDIVGFDANCPALIADFSRGSV